MSEADPKFTDPVGMAGQSRIWMPILAVLFLFLIAAAAVMLIGSLVTDARMPEAPSSPTVEQVEAGN